MAEDLTQTIELDPEAAAEENTELPDVSPEERIAKLEAALAQRDARIGELEEALASAEKHNTGLEESLAGRDAHIGELEAALGQAEVALKERGEEMESVRAQLSQAVALYRTSLLAGEPEVPEELVQGSTVEEVEASLAQARQMVEQVRSQMEAQASQERMPLGSPVRSAPDLSALSPREKILQGLSRR